VRKKGSKVGEKEKKDCKSWWFFLHFWLSSTYIPQQNRNPLLKILDLLLYSLYRFLCDKIRLYVHKLYYDTLCHPTQFGRDSLKVATVLCTFNLLCSMTKIKLFKSTYAVSNYCNLYCSLAQDLNLFTEEYTVKNGVLNSATPWSCTCSYNWRVLCQHPI